VGTLNFDFAIVMQYFYYGTDDKVGWREQRANRAQGKLGRNDERVALLSPPPSAVKHKQGWDPAEWK
jgi:hypothetical protein